MASFSCSWYTSSQIQLLLRPKIPKLPFPSTTTVTPSLISITCLQRQRTPHFSSIRVTASSKGNSNAVLAPNHKKSTKTTTKKHVKEEELPGPRVGQSWLDRKKKKLDPIYHNRLVNILVNRVMKKEKKSLAYRIIYRAMKRIQQKTETNPLFVLREAIVGVTPNVGVKTSRVGVSTHQGSIEIGYTQGKALAIRWLSWASRKRQGPNMIFKLSFEFMDAAKGSGDAIRKKEEANRMAEANRAFAHFG